MDQNLDALDGISRDVRQLQRDIAELWTMISTLQQKMSNDPTPLIEAPVYGALGGKAKTISELNYKTIGEIYRA